MSALTLRHSDTGVSVLPSKYRWQGELTDNILNGWCPTPRLKHKKVTSTRDIGHAVSDNVQVWNMKQTQLDENGLQCLMLKFIINKLDV